MGVTDEQKKEIKKVQKAIKGAKDSAEISAATLSVLLAGASSMFDVSLTPEIIAAGASLLAGIGNRITKG